jgi:hypothetical protein
LPQRGRVGDDLGQYVGDTPPDLLRNHDPLPVKFYNEFNILVSMSASK